MENNKVKEHQDFELTIFATGMHLLSNYGLTWTEIKKDGFQNIYLYKNQHEGSPMDRILSNTITGLSHFIEKKKPDLIVVHGTSHINAFVSALIDSKKNYVVIYPNNDLGSEIILEAYQRIKDNPNFKIYPSIRFEYFLTLLKHADFMIGNSSAGIREAEIYGIPAIDIGNRQKNRYHKNQNNIIHANNHKEEILHAIRQIETMDIAKAETFGDGKSDERFIKILESNRIWTLDIQKNFIDIE